MQGLIIKLFLFWQDYSDVLKTIGMFIGAITLAQVHLILSIIGITLTIAYGARKWYLMEKKHKQQDDDEYEIDN